MAISKNNMQVYATLSKELVQKIDKDAEQNSRSRSKQIEFIAKEYYKRKDKKQ